jgi:LysR family hydrogen peroxide-inducible transcriptional activator
MENPPVEIRRQGSFPLQSIQLILIDVFDRHRRSMTLQELRYLVAVGEEGHFGRAARACAVTQPTLSAAIKKLEEELGVCLFERTRRRVLATEVGRDLIAQARVALAEADRMLEIARRGREPLTGRFRLGAIPTVGPYLLPHVVAGLRRTYPELSLLLVEDVTARLLEKLRVGAIDAALLSPPLAGEDLSVSVLYQEPFLLAVPRDHPLARRRSVREADLGNVPMLLLDEGHCLRDQALAVCGRAATPVREQFRATSLETLRNMVAADVGCTLLPALAALRELHGGPRAPVVCVPFAAPAPSRQVALVWRRSLPRAEAALALAARIRAQVPKAVRRGGGDHLAAGRPRRPI